MNMHFQIAALALHLLTTILWLLPRKTKSYETRFFGFVLISSTAAVVTGILYSIFNLGMVEVRPTTIQLFARFNYMALIILMFMFFMYILSKVISEKKHRAYIYPAITMPLVESLVLLIVDIRIAPGENVVAGGYCAIVLYALALLNALCVVALLILYREKFSKWFRFITIVVLVEIAIAILAQYITELDGILEIGIVNAVALVFLALENPINKIDVTYDCFKATYIIPCIERYYTNRVNGFATYVAMQCDFTNNEAEENLAELRKKLVAELKTVPELEVFLTADRNIFVICDAPELFNDFVEDLNEVIVEIKNSLSLANNIKTAFIYAPNILTANRAEALYRHFTIAAADAIASFKNHSESYIDENAITSVEQEEKTRDLIVDALNEDRIEVFYQPIYSSNEQRFTSAEALARIRMRDGSILLPKYFIRTAENTGLIMEIGYKVFEKVCMMLTDPATGDLELDSIDINLALVQCENLELAPTFIKIAKQYEINPEIIHFDITESNYASVYKNLSKNITKLEKFGFKFTLDDFGTGESNLNSLLNIPVSYVKIDRHMIWDYFESSKVRNTVQHLVKLCHNLDIKVSATGIEKISQLDEMAIQNIDYIQGYYFFKPMPLNEYLQFLKPNAFEMDDTKKKMLKSSLNNRTIKRLG